jgi:acetoin utilization deacetylase AcuC-like enzyme
MVAKVMVYFIYHSDYQLDWPGHVFRGDKFALIYEQLIVEGIITEMKLLAPEPATEDQVQLVHSLGYLKRLKFIARNNPEFGIRECEAPVSESVLKAFYLAVGGTILACQKALETQSAAINLQGGFHHAFPAHGEGFCLLNDLAIAIRVLQKQALIQRAMIIDCDLHQGNGTAFIFKDDPSVFTFSIHQENTYPEKKKSSLDIGLDDGAGDDDYLNLLHMHIPEIIAKHKPELIICQSGVDPFEDDRLGNLKLTKSGLAERDRYIFQTVRHAGIPLAVTLGGGYSTRMQDMIDLHCQTARILKEIFTPAHPPGFFGDSGGKS